ncbi:MAG: hypothetical protein ACI9S8_002737 [Chlamydiales bacterium]|jgi:hypothetical protein
MDLLSASSTPDARRKFAAETILSARICNAADGVLNVLNMSILFLLGD